MLVSVGVMLPCMFCSSNTELEKIDNHITMTTVNVVRRQGVLSDTGVVQNFGSVYHSPLMLKCLLVFVIFFAEV